MATTQTASSPASQPARWRDTRVVDGLTVEIRTSPRVRFGNSERPGVVIWVVDPEPMVNSFYLMETDLTLVSTTLPAPGREVFERDTINQIGRPGAFVFQWQDGWQGAWLDREVAALVKRASGMLANRPPARYSPRMLRAICATAHRLADADPQREFPAWSDLARAADHVESGDPLDPDDRLAARLLHEFTRSERDARLIDDEASLAIRRIERGQGRWVEYRPICRLRVAPEVAEDLRAAWGGSVSHEADRSDVVLWQITGRPLVWMLTAMRPSLARQRTLADLILALRAVQDERPQGGRRPEDLAAEMEDLYRRSLAVAND